jgi:hypothetical protein
MKAVRAKTTLPIPVLAGLLLLQCAVLGERGGRGSSFDPLGFPGDDTVLTADAKPIVTPDDIDEQGGFVEPGAGTSQDSRAVVRVQFFATTSLSEAEDVRQRAIRTLSQHVSIDFETPYYKLKIGPLRDEDAAQRLVVRLRAMGFESAWVVRERPNQQVRRQ